MSTANKTLISAILKYYDKKLSYQVVCKKFFIMELISNSHNLKNTNVLFIYSKLITTKLLQTPL